MNNLEIFENKEFGKLRTLIIDDEPWFVGKDLADALGYSNAYKAVAMHVDDADRTLKQLEIADSQNGRVVKTQVTLINESGLYSLVLSSKLPTAKKFKHWVTSEVLPAIRKHGAYATPATIESIISNPEFGIQLLTTLKAEQEKNKQLSQKVDELRPKALFSDAVSASSQTILVGALAKLIKQNGYDIGQNRLFTWMRENGYLINQSGKNFNMPTQYSMNLGLFRVKETAITHSDGHVTLSKTPLVTGKGQQYFINKFLGEKEDAENEDEAGDI